jgi:hypothetical protein
MLRMPSLGAKASVFFNKDYTSSKPNRVLWLTEHNEANASVYSSLCECQQEIKPIHGIDTQAYLQ